MGKSHTQEDDLEDDESNTELLRQCLEHIENEAVESGWYSDHDGWLLVNRIRKVLDMLQIQRTDEPDYSHFKKNH